MLGLSQKHLPLQCCLNSKSYQIVGLWEFLELWGVAISFKDLLYQSWLFSSFGYFDTRIFFSGNVWLLLAIL